MLHNQCVITARLALCHFQRLGLRFNPWFQITESKAVSVLWQLKFFVCVHPILRILFILSMDLQLRLMNVVVWF